MSWVRERSRDMVDSAQSPWSAGLGATLYAINSVTEAVVAGTLDGARLVTNGEERSQFIQGMGALLTTSPATMASAAWGHWSQMSNEQRYIAGAAMLVSLPKGVTSASVLADALPAGSAARSSKVLGAAGEVPNSGKTVTLYRVDDASYAPRIAPDGSVPVVATRAGSERALFVNIGQPERAKDFALVNRGGNATVTAVEVDASLLERLRATSVYDRSPDVGLYPNAPLRVDIKKAPDQFGLRTPEHFDWLREAIKLYTARVIDPKDL